jgi:hypothetical protein
MECMSKASFTRQPADTIEHRQIMHTYITTLKQSQHPHFEETQLTTASKAAKQLYHNTNRSTYLTQCVASTGYTTSPASTTARNAFHATCQDDWAGAAKDGMMPIASFETQPVLEILTHQLR